MRKNRSAHIAFLVFATLFSPLWQEESDTPTRTASMSWRSELDEKILEILERMTYGDDINSSLFAKWTECKLRCNNASAVDTLAAKYEFIGFVSGKTNAAVPHWWTSHLMAADPNRLKDFSFPDRDVTSTFGLSHESNIKLKKLDNKFVTGAIDGDEFQFQWYEDEADWVLDDGEEPRQAILFLAIKQLPEGEHIFAISNRFNCVDVVRQTAEGAVVWRSQINNVRRIQEIEADGPWSGRIKIEFNDNKVRIYGSSCVCLFMEVFDFEIGKTECKFCTLR